MIGQSIKRKPLTRNQRVQMFADHGGICVTCKTKIWAERGDGFIDEHIVALENGGTNDMSNRGPAHIHCAREKTKNDHKLGAKIKRQQQRHIGIKKAQSRPLGGTVASGWKRKFDGTVERR